MTGPETAIPEISAEIPETQVSPFATWQQTQEPGDLMKVVDTLEPTINRNLAKYGLAEDAMARSKARVFAGQAVRKFDPGVGVSMPTWVDRNLQQLSRFKRTRATAVRVPERVQLDSGAISRAIAEFSENYDREPDLEELSDATGLTVDRIANVRKTFRKMTSEHPFEGNLSALQDDTPLVREALDGLWRDSDKIDRQIIEHKTGFGGTEVIPAKDIALKLGIHPVALSRRSARLMARLDEQLELLEDVIR